MSYFIICLLSTVLGKNYTVNPGDSFVSMYNKDKDADGDFAFKNGTFSEPSLTISSTTQKLALTGSENTEYRSTSSTYAFDISHNSITIRFVNLKFTSSTAHTQTYFKGTAAAGIDLLYFNNCVITGITPPTITNPLLIVNSNGTVRVILNNTEIKNLTLGNFDLGGLIVLRSNSTNSNVLFENTKISGIQGKDKQNGVIVFDGTAGFVNFTKSSFEDVNGTGGTYGFVFSRWNLYIGRSSFNRLTNISSGCVYCNFTNLNLTVISTSFNAVTFRTQGGAVFFIGGSHSYTDVNITNIKNCTKTAWVAGIHSRCTTETVYWRCYFAGLWSAKATTINQELLGKTQIKGCKFSDIRALNGRPAGIESPAVCDVFDSEFEGMTATGLSTVFHVYAPMIWKAITIRHCASNGNGGVCCQLDAVVCDNATFINVSSGQLGAISHWHSGSISYTQCLFQNCVAATQGGAVWAPKGNSASSKFFFSNCWFYNNTAKTSGGGNDIYFTGSGYNNLSPSNMYGCCSTSAQPRINNKNDMIAYLPQCSVGARYLNVTGGTDEALCGNTPAKPCRTLKYIGTTYSNHNPLEIIMSGETFAESNGLNVSGRTIEVTGNNNGMTVLRCAGQNEVIVSIDNGRFIGQYLHFDALREGISKDKTTHGIRVVGPGQFTLRDCSFTHQNATDLPMNGPLLHVNNSQASLTFERVVFKKMRVVNSSPVFISCLLASFTGCDFYNLYSSGTGSFGGAITFTGGFLQLYVCTFKSCNTTFSGGAVFLTNSSLISDSVIFENCNATNHGGAIHYVAPAPTSSSTLTVRLALCQFVSNSVKIATNGNDIRDENGANRWNANNVVDCCSTGLSDSTHFRFSVGSATSPQSNDQRLPTCYFNPCAGQYITTCPKECSWINGNCTENNCTRLNRTETCPAGCVMFEEGTPQEFCYQDFCAKYKTEPNCKADLNCTWANNKCQIHACTVIPGDPCPLEKNCRLLNNTCIVNNCTTPSCVDPPPTCEARTNETACKNDPVLRCAWFKNKCYWDPCQTFVAQTPCLSFGCSWTFGGGGRCEWNQCVFLEGENSSAPCHEGCRRDPALVCSVDICRDLTTADLCGRQDCTWNSATNTCDWHACVRLHGEPDCYAGCVLNTQKKCVHDGGCSAITDKSPCVSNALCVWIGEDYKNPSSKTGSCVRNHCQGKEPCNNGCKVDTNLLCVIDECFGIYSEDDCPAECTWNVSASECKSNDCVRLNNAPNCAKGCYNASNVCRVDPCHVYGAPNPCKLSGCTWEVNPQAGKPGQDAGWCKANKCVPTEKLADGNLPASGCNDGCKKNAIGVCMADPCLDKPATNCGNCTLIPGACEYNKCVPLGEGADADLCPSGCKPDPISGKCMPDVCDVYRTMDTCIKNESCFWTNTAGCEWNDCKSNKTNSTDCGTGCVYYKAIAGCIPDTCSIRLTQATCAQSDCVWNIDTSKCEYHDCVRVYGEADCAAGCVKDLADKCKENFCKPLNTKTACEKTDCMWSASNISCIYHPCVRTQDEKKCYDGCEFLINNTCTLDICRRYGPASTPSECPRDCVYSAQERVCKFQKCLRPTDVDACATETGLCVLNSAGMCVESAGCAKKTKREECEKESLCEWNYLNNTCVDNICKEDCSDPCKVNGVGSCVTDNCTDFKTVEKCEAVPTCTWDYVNGSRCIFNPCSGATCATYNSTCKPAKDQKCRPDVCSDFLTETNCLKDPACVWDGTRTLCLHNPCVNATLSNQTCINSPVCELDDRGVCVNNTCPDYRSASTCHAHRPAICAWNYGTSKCEYNKCVYKNPCTGVCMEGPTPAGAAAGRCWDNICSQFHSNSELCNMYAQCYFNISASKCLPNTCAKETYVNATGLCSNSTICKPNNDGICKPDTCSDYRTEKLCSTYKQCFWNSTEGKCFNNPCSVEHPVGACSDGCASIANKCVPDNCSKLVGVASCVGDSSCYWNENGGAGGSGSCEFNPCLKDENNTETSCVSNACKIYIVRRICYPDPCLNKKSCNPDCESTLSPPNCTYQPCVRFFNEPSCYPGCELQGGRCVVDSCRNLSTEAACDTNSGCLWDTEKCILNNCTNKCGATVDPSCMSIDGKCTPNLCYGLSEKDCERTDCVYEKGACTYHPCVRLNNEKTCYKNCEFDQELKCTNDTCSHHKTGVACLAGGSDCTWDGTACKYHKCVRLHGEPNCYSGCKKQNDRCVEDKCHGKSKPDLCPGDCIWNYTTNICDDHICVRPEGNTTCPADKCVETTSGDCRPKDLCPSFSVRDLCEDSGCYWNDREDQPYRCVDNNCELKVVAGVITCSTGCMLDKTLQRRDICVPDPCYNKTVCPHYCAIDNTTTPPTCTSVGGCVSHPGEPCPVNCIEDPNGLCTKNPCSPFTKEHLCPEECKWVVPDSPWVADHCNVTNCTRLHANETECYDGCVFYHEKPVCVEDRCIIHKSKEDCPPDCRWNGTACKVGNCTMLNGDECKPECIYKDRCIGSPCSQITNCSEEDGCKTNTDKSLGAEVCLDDPCYKFTARNPCFAASINCTWIDDHCEAADECKNSQNITLDGLLICRDGCVPDPTTSKPQCIRDPCAENTNQSECGDRSTAAYQCKYNRSAGICRGHDACTKEGTTDECLDGCKLDSNGKCKPDVCLTISVDEFCNQWPICAWLDGGCKWNPCQIADPENGQCPKGCELDDLTQQCAPDICVKEYYPGAACADSAVCAPTTTDLFGETCTYDPNAAKAAPGSKFPYWVILVGLLGVAAIAGIAIGAAVYVWKAKKGEKTKMEIQDVGRDEIDDRDIDAMDVNSGTDSNADGGTVTSKSKLYSRDDGMGGKTEDGSGLTEGSQNTSNDPSRMEDESSLSRRSKKSKTKASKKSGSKKRGSKSKSDTKSVSSNYSSYSRKSSRSKRSKRSKGSRRGETSTNPSAASEQPSDADGNSSSNADGYSGSGSDASSEINEEFASSADEGPGSNRGSHSARSNKSKSSSGKSKKSKGSKSKRSKSKSKGSQKSARSRGSSSKRSRGSVHRSPKKSK